MAIETVVLHRNYQQIISEFHPELTDVPNSVQTLAKHGITVREVSGSILAPEITLADGRWDPRLLTWRSSNHA